MSQGRGNGDANADKSQMILWKRVEEDSGPTKGRHRWLRFFPEDLEVEDKRSQGIDNGDSPGSDTERHQTRPTMRVNESATYPQNTPNFAKETTKYPQIILHRVDESHETTTHLETSPKRVKETTAYPQNHENNPNRVNMVKETTKYPWIILKRVDETSAYLERIPKRAKQSTAFAQNNPKKATTHRQRNHKSCYTCGECNGYFHWSTCKLYQHLLGHMKARQFKCTTCSALFSTPGNLQHHLRSKGHERQLNQEEKDNVKRVRSRYVLARQSKASDTLVLLDVDTLEKEPVLVFMCQACQEELHGSAACDKHTSDVHDGENVQYQCIHCFTTETSLAYMHSHILTSECRAAWKGDDYNNVSSSGPLEDYKLKGLDIDSLVSHVVDKEVGEVGTPKRVLITVGFDCSIKAERATPEREHFILQRERRQRGLTVQQVQCDVCGRLFRNGNDLRKHRMRHTESKNFVCAKDGKRFRTNRDLTSHTKLVHLGIREPISKVVLLCHICGFQAWKKSVLKQHMTTFHRPLSVRHCRICSKTFITKRLWTLRRHEQSHSALAVKCEECGKMVKAFYMKQHMRLTHVHRKISKKFKCDKCSYTAHYKDQIARHQAVHTGDRKFKCSECDAAFTQLTSLERHKSIHTGQKNHKCGTCGKAFIQKCTLDRHRITHEGLKPYKCAICAAKYSQSYPLTMHMKKKHPDVQSSS